MTNQQKSQAASAASVETPKLQVGAKSSLQDAPPKVSSLDLFEKSIARASNLIHIHKDAHGKQSKPPKHLSDCHRAAIVLAIAALDAYIRALVLDRVCCFVEDRHRELPPQLAAKIKNFLKEDLLLEAARKDDLLERVEKAFKADYERRSFQGTDAISEAMQLIGFKDIFHDIALNSKMNEDTLKRDLDRFTRRRHEIAHRGDYDLSQAPPIENKVTKSDAEACIKIVNAVARGIEVITKQ